MPIDPTIDGWDVQSPPRPRYANGFAIGMPPPSIVNPGPWPDPGFPVEAGGAFGNPTGPYPCGVVPPATYASFVFPPCEPNPFATTRTGSNILFNGFILGWDPPTVLPSTPGSGGSTATPPPWNGTDDEATYIANCVTHLTGAGVDATMAQAMCQVAWDEAQSAARSDDTVPVVHHGAAAAPGHHSPPRSRGKR